MVERQLHLERWWVNMDIKNQVAPKGLEFRPASMVISDKFVTILTVVSYP